MTQSSAPNTSGSLTRLAGIVAFGLAALATYLPAQFWSEEDFGWGPGGFTLVACLLLALHVALVWTRTTPLDPAVWLPIALIFFYFGGSIAVEGIGRGLKLDYDPWGVGAPLSLSRGYCAAVLALSAYLLGIHVAGVKDLSRLTARSGSDQSLALPALVLTIGALGMLGVGVALVGPAVVFGTYSEWWGAKAAGADARFVDIGIVLAQAGTFALIASHNPKRQYRLYLAYAVASLLIYVAIQKGARASLMATGVGLIWCYSQRVKRLNSGLVSALVLTAVLLFPILGEYRHTKRVDVEGQTFQSLLARSTYDMGSSVNTLIYTMDFVPRSESYAWGVGYVEAAYQLIPNLGLTPNRSDGITNTLKAFHSNWVTWQVSPHWAAQGGGYGSSMAGELYFNFGVSGILLGCALVGFLSGRLRSSVQDSAFKLTASALFFGTMVIYVRNPIGVPIKNFLWSLAALLAIRGTLSLLVTRSSNARVSRPIQL